MKIFVVLLLMIISLQASAQKQRVKVATNLGNFIILLYDSTPLHRDNFIKLVKEHHYDSLLFHRVIKGFVVQAGDPVSKHANDTMLLGDGDLGYTVPAEIFPDKYYHHRAAVGMARDDNPEKSSSACQFYVVQGRLANDSIFDKATARTGGYKIPEDHKKVYREKGGIPHLDSRYTVFGEVVKGMDVIDKIASVPTDKNDRPLQPVRIKNIKLIK